MHNALYRSVSTAVVILAVSGSPKLQGKPPEDREIAAKLVGIWMAHPDQYGLSMKAGIYTFRADKTFVISGGFAHGGRHLDVEVAGKWWIENSVLFEEITKTSFPEVAPIGHVDRETILGISDEGCWLREEDGKEHFLTRYKG
jgi:hypothetical protein